MRERRSQSFVASLLSITLLMVVIHPIALAESAWEEDGWLRTSYANDRLMECRGSPGATTLVL
jgi:hypothetical protein